MNLTDAYDVLEAKAQRERDQLEYDLDRLLKLSAVSHQDAAVVIERVLRQHRFQARVC